MRWTDSDGHGQVANTLKKRDVVTYSEIYGMSWDGITTGMEVSTAGVPVYDKRDTDRWVFLGMRLDA